MPKKKKSKKSKKKLTQAQKKAKAEFNAKHEWIFINGKRKRVKKPQTIDGLTVDEFIENNADPIWLHQNGMWELMDQEDNDYSEEDD